MTAGLVYVGRVVGTGPGGPRVIVPELGGNSPYGPLPCAVPDLAVGETVVVTGLGTSRDQLVVLGRMAGRAPNIGEVPGLTAAITAVNGRVDVVVTDQDADQVTIGLHGTRITGVENVNTTQNGRLSTAETTIGGHADTLGAHGTRLTATEGVANGASSGLTTLRADTAGKATTKGDLLAATAAGILARQGAPANGLALVADSAQTTGWIGKDLLGMPKALTGAVAATRYVGATAAGAPTTGPFVAGDVCPSLDGNVYVCTVAGTPGTWVTHRGNGPRGVLARARRTVNITEQTGVGPIPKVTELSVPIISGRLYQICANNIGFYATNAGAARAILSITTDGSVPTSNSPNLQWAQVEMLAGGRVVTLSTQVLYPAVVTATARILLSAYLPNGSGTWGIYATAEWPLDVFAEDVGPTVAAGGTQF